MIYYSLSDYQKTEYGTAVALGFFDGVHLGHREVLKKAVGKLRSVALTFDKSPLCALGKTAPPTLTDNSEKAELITALGVDDVVFADFVKIKDLSPEDFVGEVLVKRLNAKKICCGFNYHFGRLGSGDTAKLLDLCQNYGIELEVCPPIELEGEQISSSLIRKLIADGRIEQANKMLGYRYALSGEIKSGNRIGSTLGFPTVNIPVPAFCAVPKYGVYAAKVSIGDRVFKGAANIGVHPTVGESPEVLCEVFLLDFEGGDLYGKEAVCELAAFVRPEKRFGSLSELTDEIDRNCDYIRALDFDKI